LCARLCIFSICCAVRVIRLFVSSCICDHLDLHSFPTRRSSDLKGLFWIVGIMTFYLLYSLVGVHYNTPKAIFYDFFIQIKPFIEIEEHTSELQSRFDLVCRLLLDKKQSVHVPLFSAPSHHPTPL